MAKHLLIWTSICSMLIGCDAKQQGDGGTNKKQFQGSAEPEPIENSVSGGENEDGNGGGGLDEENSEVEDEGGTDEEDGELSESIATPLKVALKRVDSNHVGIELKIMKLDKSWHEFSSSTAGADFDIEDVCEKNKKCELKISAIDEDGTEVFGANECFIGLEVSPTEIGIGFENNCSSDDYHNIDDLIFTISAEDVDSIEVDGLKMTGSECNLIDWVADDNCGGLFSD